MRAAELVTALDESGFVYISPLKSDGQESTCHAEVWFAHLDRSVVLITGAERWKARAVSKGLDRARIWVGDRGRWKQLIGRNAGFRKAPHFDARVERVQDEKLLERMLAVFDEKYPEEIADWRDRMRSGFRDGTRHLLRYTPI